MNLSVLWYLICGHALADFSLQTDVMAKGKNWHNKPDVPPGQARAPVWVYWLTSHALIHGGAVAVVTRSPLLGLLEFFVHWITDFAKCANLTTVHVDQAIHLASKILWCFLWSQGVR